MTYDEARAEFERLESIAELDDQVELMGMLWDLMRNPTRACARDMYVQAIGLWHNEHGKREG